MDIKKITYIITNKAQGFTLAIPMFVVGLVFMILGVTIFPGIGILLGIFVWWIAWRFMLSSSRKSQIKEALKRIKERQMSSSVSKVKASTPKPDVKNESGTKDTPASEKQETTRTSSGH